MEAPAMIVPAEDGRLRILLNRGITQHERQNFSICHEVANGREDWGMAGHLVYDIEAMYLPPLDGSDVTPRVVSLLMPPNPVPFL